MAAISPDDLDARLTSDPESVLVVDIRPSDTFGEWHIPGSRNVDVYETLQNGDEEAAVAALADLPEGREIVTVCAAGVVSQTATDLLVEHGYDARTLTDGMRGWSRVHRRATVDVDIDGILVQVARPGKGCLSYVLVSDGAAAIIDPSRYVEEYDAILDDYDAELAGVYDTHAHADHVSGGRQLADRHGVAYHLHPADQVDVDAEPVTDGQSIAVGEIEVTVRHTPGHSPGGVTYDVAGAAVLTGDTLFHESVGRVELGVEAGLEATSVRENAGTLYDSLQRLLAVPGDPLILPAHDPGTPDPPVSGRLSAVRARNGDLGRDREAFVEALAADVPEHPPNFRRVKRANVGAADIAPEELADLEVGPNRCAAE